MLRTDIKLITPSQMTDNMIFALQEPLLLRIGQMFPPVFSQLLGAIFVNVERAINLGTGTSAGHDRRSRAAAIPAFVMFVMFVASRFPPYAQ